ncbi:MAG TPA: class I SAM-dependent methyltransferase [Syntrophorhabdaceae bacterium]|nr:class I SAM-dependent methyltransferase [Syntrophorhabdaceae bacterium]
MMDYEIYKKRKDFFETHAQKWDDMWYKDTTTGQYVKHRESFERLFNLLPLKEGDSVLDVGCGTGILVPFILDRIKDKGMLYEMDYAYEMLHINLRLHREKNVRFILAEAENTPFKEGMFHGIICFSCFPHFHDKKNALLSMVRTLKKGGYFIVSHFDSSKDLNMHHAQYDAVMHDYLPDEDTMKGLFSMAGLNIYNFIDETGFYYIMAQRNN